ncbi:MAG: S41 family peptidase [Bacteroidales bacterium]|nr:S41 family peptidase [Bacteroidales bacterium]
MKKHVKTSVAVLLFFVALAAGLAAGALLPRTNTLLGTNSSSRRNFALRKLNYAMDLVENLYVDSFSYDTLVDNTLSTLLFSLDPHSAYYSAEELKHSSEELSGHIEGIGALLRQKDDTVRILQVMPGGPASHSDLQPGDKIIAVDGKTVAGVNMSIEDVIKKIKGRTMTHVTLTIMRYGTREPRNINLKRNAVNTPSVLFRGMLTDTIGYIGLSSFTMTSHDEFCDAVKTLKQKGMRHLVLDLRNNGGGLMSAATSIADELLPGKELIVYTQGAHQPREDIRSTPGGLFGQGGVTVMINEASASASEIVSGAVQDNDRGSIVGRRSFGKGLVQSQYPLPDHSALHLTTARYYTPSGRCIQRSYEKGTQAYMMDYILRLYDTQQGDTLPPHPNDTTRYYTRKGRVVYGGGGITPDHQLHIFTDSALIYFNKMNEKALLDNVALQFVERNYAALKKHYPTENDFVKRFTTPDALSRQLLHEADKAGLMRDPATLAKYGSYIRLTIKARIATSLYGSAANARILLSEDKELEETLMLITKR